MTSADATALAVLVFMPIVLVTRALLRRSRGQPFTRDELVTVVVAIAITLAAVALFRSAWVAILLPGALAGFGLLLVGREYKI